jgi:hypothetical protein
MEKEVEDHRRITASLSQYSVLKDDRGELFGSWNQNVEESAFVTPDEALGGEQAL